MNQLRHHSRNLIAAALILGTALGFTAVTDVGRAHAVSPSPYVNPLRAVTGLVQERVDQGVDYDANAGSPIYALGDGVVVLAPPVPAGRAAMSFTNSRAARPRVIASSRPRTSPRKSASARPSTRTP